MAQATAQIGVTGLGVMGRNLARNFARQGYAVALHNRTVSRVTDMVTQFGHEGHFVPAQTAEEFVASLERPRRLLIMVNAGPATDAVIDEFAPLLEPGVMIIDGGNAHFKDTRRREAALRQQNQHFVGMGVSGGEEGALNVFRACVAFLHVRPLLECAHEHRRIDRRRADRVDAQAVARIFERRRLGSVPQRRVWRRCRPGHESRRSAP